METRKAEVGSWRSEVGCRKKKMTNEKLKIRLSDGKDDPAPTWTD